MDISELAESGVFWVLTAVGYGAFVFMLAILKAMGNKEIMPLWVKIITMLAIPIAAALFTGYAEN